MKQLDQPPTPPAQPQEPHPRRHVGLVVGILCLVAILFVALYLAQHRPPATPQTYGGPQTANDVLWQVVTDPSGGVWATGIRYDKALSQPNVQPLSTFILHLEHGRWVTSHVFDWSAGLAVSALAMVGSDEGWAVGTMTTTNHAVLLHDDHGTWTTLPLHPAGALNAVVMVSPSEGWAVGGTPGKNGSALILHFTAGTWTQIVSPVTGILQSISMVSASEGWAAGNGGATLLHYTHGTWTNVPLASGQAPLAIAMLSAHEGWAVGVGGTILHYANGTWSKVNGV